MTRMNKICPCTGCGKVSQCVSHDGFRFYCNRCLPYFTRQKLYWKEEAPVEQPKAEAKTTSKKSTTKKSKTKKSVKSNE